MKRALFAVAILGIVGIAQADTAKDVITKKATEFTKAMKAKDMKWFEKTAAMDFHEIIKGGKRIERKAALDDMRQSFKSMTVKSISNKVISAKMDKNVITATLSMNMTAEMPGGKGQKPMVMGMKGTMQEKWRKVGNDWQIFEIKQLTQSMTMNGKPMGGGH